VDERDYRICSANFCRFLDRTENVQVDRIEAMILDNPTVEKLQTVALTMDRAPLLDHRSLAEQVFEFLDHPVEVPVGKNQQDNLVEEPHLLGQQKMLLVVRRRLLDHAGSEAV